MGNAIEELKRAREKRGTESSKAPIGNEGRGEAEWGAGEDAGATITIETESSGERRAWWWVMGGECEVVIGGVLQRIRYRGINPATVLERLRELDAAVKVRDAFPMKMGPREVKTAVVMVLQIRGGENKQIKMVAQGEKTINVGVMKKSVDGFMGELRALGKLSEEHLAEAEAAFVKGDAAIVLSGGEKFTVSYWTTDDGGHFMDGMTAEVKEVGGAGSGV